MSSTTPSRRSGRQRLPNKRYTVDAFEGLELTGDLEDDLQDQSVERDEADDAEFHAGQSPEPEDEDVLSNTGGVENDLASDADDFEPDDLDDGESIIGNDADGDKTPRRRNGADRLPQAIRASTQKSYTRGLVDTELRGSKEMRSTIRYGPSKDDQYPVAQAFYKWSKQPCLPTRKADMSGLGGFSKGFTRTEKMLKQEMAQDWEWYDDHGGKAAFERRQSCDPILPADAESYLPKPGDPLQVAMGPYDTQKVYTLSMGDHMNLSEPFQTPESTDNLDERSSRRGWLLNIGDKVQCMEWAPNQSSRRQLLALSTVPVHGHSPDHEPFQSPHAPAWTPQPAHKGAIQIWEFSVGMDNLPDLARSPKLRSVLTTEWGDLKTFKWCPAPRKEEQPKDGTEVDHLGLLASVWSDGHVRVLDLSVYGSHDDPTTYVQCTAAAFDCLPTNTVCTSVAWLSSTSIVAGCANGCVGIWNISTSIHAHESNPTPVYFAAIQTSYIMDVATCYPSRPQMIISSSTAGYISMTDLSEVSSAGGYSPTSTVFSRRFRIPRKILAWHDWSATVVSVDDNYSLVSIPLRRFFNNTGLTKYPSPCASLGVSPVHPFFLAGCVGGEALAGNWMRRNGDNKVHVWNQKWFAHEWRRMTLNEPQPTPLANESIMTDVAGDQDVEMTGVDQPVKETLDQPPMGTMMQPSHDNVAQPDKDPKGLARILEGFKPEHVKLTIPDSNGVRNNGSTTVHEVASAVTQVCWNPNIHVGGWAAAGTASGLLRVEDIAI